MTDTSAFHILRGVRDPALYHCMSAEEMCEHEGWGISG